MCARARARTPVHIPRNTSGTWLPIDGRALVIDDAGETRGTVASSLSHIASRVSPEGKTSASTVFSVLSPRQPSPVDGSRQAAETWLSLGITFGTTGGENGLPRWNSHPFLVFPSPSLALAPFSPRRGRERGDFSRPVLLFSRRLALVIGREHRTHARTHARTQLLVCMHVAHTYVPARWSKAVGKTRATASDGTTERDRGALDRRPSRGSSIAATKRGRTRPLVFIRVPPGMTVSLSFAAHPPPRDRDERVHGQEDTHKRSRRSCSSPRAAGPEKARPL